MRSTLRTIAMASLLAVGGSLGLGVSPALACDHGPGGSYGRTASWGYRAEFGYPAPAPYGGMSDDDRCPICHPAPPICEPPPCESGLFVVRESRRVAYEGLQRKAYLTRYSSLPALPAYPQSYGAPEETQTIYPSPQGAMPYRSRYSAPSPELPYPTKQGPAVYGSPQGPTSYPTPEGPESYANPQVPDDAAPPPPPDPEPGPGSGAAELSDGRERPLPRTR